MNSHNALVAGGYTVSGALGENSSIKIDGLSSFSTGTDYQVKQSFEQMADAYNLDPRNADRKLKKDANGKYLQPSEQPQEALDGFGEFAKDNSYNKEVINNAVPELATTLGTAGTVAH